MMQQTLEFVADTDARWRKFATETVHTLAATGYSFTVDEVRDLVEPLGLTPSDPRLWGSLMLAQAKAGRILDTDTVKRSRHATAGGRRVVVWIGAAA